MADRLDAFIARAGLGSRTDAKKMIRGGRVALDGAVCRDPQASVGGRAVTCDGKPVAAPRSNVVLLMHKPLGVSCSHDVREEPLVFDLLPTAFSTTPLECVGRLDRETSGLLLLTDDGALNHRLTSPKRHVIKRYRAEFTGALFEDAERRFAAGILLHGEDLPTRPALLRRTGEGRADVELAEGRYHQVRRMFSACGAEVVLLHRDRIGALELPPELKAGDAREATAEEIAAAVTGVDDRAPINDEAGPEGSPPPPPR